MGGRAPSVQQSGGGQHERARAQGGHARPRLVGRTHRADEIGGRVLVGVRPAGNDHGVGMPEEPVEPLVGLQPEPAEPYGVRPADLDVVPGDGHVDRSGAEHLVRHGQFELQHPLGDGQRDGNHVRNCMGDVVPDTHDVVPAARMFSADHSSTGENPWDTDRR